MQLTPYPGMNLSTPAGVRSTLIDDKAPGVQLTLPLRVQQVFMLGDFDDIAGFLRVTIILKAFGTEEDDTLRVGISSVRSEAFVEPDEAEEAEEPGEEGPEDEELEQPEDSINGWLSTPIPFDALKAVSMRELAVSAIQRAGKSDEGSVARGQALRLLAGRNVRRSASAAEKLRRASVAYLEAKGRGAETSPAVVRALGLKRDQKAAARNVVFRAVQAGVLQQVATELGLEHLLTEKQRNTQPEEQS